MLDVKRYPRESLRDEKGMVLVVALLLIAALLLLGTTAVMTSTTDMKISANYKTANMAFYVAEAGIEETRARLAANFTPATGYIDDPVSNHTNLTWSVSIGGAGPYTSIQPALSYTVSIVHKKNAANQILYWGDVNGDGFYERTASPTSATGMANKNIYLVTSNGLAANASASKTIEVEMAKLPPITMPGALYVNASTSIIGNANINGLDQCGTAATNVPGIVSTLASGTVDKSNNSKITGTGGSPSITYNHPVLNVRSMIDAQKGDANYTYNVVSATNSGMSWGLPQGATPVDLSKPSSCSVSNIVYYNTSNGNNLTDIKLSGGTTGCGVLLIDGDLDINGSFSWYGIILVSGSVKYTGGGNNNVTGAIVAGGSVVADSVGGNSNILYCSSAVNSQTESKPLNRLSWKEQNI